MTLYTSGGKMVLKTNNILNTSALNPKVLIINVTFIWTVYKPGTVLK